MAAEIAACAARAERQYVAQVRMSGWDDAAEAAFACVPASLVAQHVQATTVYGGAPSVTHTVIMARPELLLLAVHLLGRIGRGAQSKRRARSVS